MINANEASLMAKERNRLDKEAKMASLEQKFGYFEQLIKERAEQGHFFLEIDVDYDETAQLKEYVNSFGYKFVQYTSAITSTVRKSGSIGRLSSDRYPRKPWGVSNGTNRRRKPPSKKVLLIRSICPRKGLYLL